MRAASVFTAVLLAIVSQSSAQLGICSTTPLDSTDISGPVFTAEDVDTTIDATQELCQLNLQDWPVAASLVNLSNARLAIPQGVILPPACNSVPVELFFRTDTGTLHYCSAQDTWSQITGTGTSGSQVDIDGDGTREINLIGAALQFDPNEDGSAEAVFTADGNLGIGTSTPGHRIDLLVSESAPTDLLAVENTLGPAKITLINSSVVNSERFDQLWRINSNGTLRFGAGSDSPELLLEANGELMLQGSGAAVRINDTNNQVMLSLAGDRIFHDTNADGVKGSGERFIDEAGGGGGGLPSIRNPSGAENPASCEFDSLCTGWTWSTGVVDQAINPLDSHTGNGRYDMGLWDGWLAWQSDESAAEDRLWTSAVVAADATLVAHLRVPIIHSQDTQLEGQEGGIVLALRNSGTGYADSVNMFVYEDDGSGFDTVEFICNNGGSEEIRELSFNTDLGGLFPAICKSTNDYYFYMFSEVGGYLYLGQCTKTGVTVMDQINLAFRGANETPSIVQGVDFVRLYDSHVWDLWN